MKASHRRKIGASFLVIPDGQVKPGVPLSHWSAIGNYIVDRQVDRVINLGDFADLPSLSSYSVGKLEAEGQRYTDDVRSVKEAMGMLMSPLHKHNRGRRKKYTPGLDMCLGNHDDRADRVGKDFPHLLGAISSRDLGYAEAGWDVHPFLKVITRNAVQFSHYFQSGPLGRPVSSAAAMLRTRQASCVQGHVQICDVAIHPRTGYTAVMAGTCYQHDEGFLGYQLNSCRRQVIVLHEVCEGRFDLMMVSLAFLLAKYS